MVRFEKIANKEFTIHCTTTELSSNIQCLLITIAVAVAYVDCVGPNEHLWGKHIAMMTMGKKK